MPDPSNLTDGHIYVDYRHADNATENMISQTGAIARTLTSLEMELGALRRSWIGEDKDAYNTVQEAWNNAVEGMQRLLRENAGLLTEIAHGYRRTEQGLAQNWAQLPGGRA